MPYKDPVRQKAAQHDAYLRQKEILSERNRSRMLASKQWYREFMTGKCCSICSESTLVCLDWHHVDPSDKTANVSWMVNHFRPKPKILEEMDKCILVCANCHRKLHAGLLRFRAGN